LLKALGKPVAKVEREKPSTMPAGVRVRSAWAGRAAMREAAVASASRVA